MTAGDGSEPTMRSSWVIHENRATNEMALATSTALNNAMAVVAFWPPSRRCSATTAVGNGTSTTHISRFRLSTSRTPSTARTCWKTRWWFSHITPICRKPTK